MESLHLVNISNPDRQAIARLGQWIALYYIVKDFSLRGCDWKPQRTSRVLGRMGTQAVEMNKISPLTACSFLSSDPIHPVQPFILLKTKKEFPLVNQDVVCFTRRPGFSAIFFTLVSTFFSHSLKF